MVNTLSGSVSAYRKEIVKPRFIRKIHNRNNYADI